MNSYLYKIYGFFEDDPNIIDKIQHTLSNLNIFEVEKSKDTRIDFFYWGNCFVDLDSLIEDLKKYFTPQTYGQIDFIDFDEWKMKRIEIKKGNVLAKPIPLNKSWDPYTLS